MTTPNATPKPRAGEHTPSSTPETDALCSDPAIERRDVPARVWREMARIEAERDLLRERERELVEALSALTDICDSVPVFQLDDGKASVKAVRLAAKFTGAHRIARAVLAKVRP